MKIKEPLPDGSYVAAFPTIAHQEGFFTVNPHLRCAGRVIRPAFRPGEVYAIVVPFASESERMVYDERYAHELSRARASYKKFLSDQAKEKRRTYGERLRKEMAEFKLRHTKDRQASEVI